MTRSLNRAELRYRRDGRITRHQYASRRWTGPEALQRGYKAGAPIAVSLEYATVQRCVSGANYGSTAAHRPGEYNIIFARIRRL